MSPPLLAPRYMSRFRCIADRCEATCCSGMLVAVSAAEWARVQRAVAQDTGVELQPLRQRDTTGTEALFLPKGGDGHCHFMEADKLCTLYRRHGDSVPPDVCATYPRVTLRWETRLEVAGTLGCPEVARLALLAEDALEVEPLAQEQVPRPEAAKPVSTGDAGEGWSFHASAVRATALHLLRRSEVPLTVRLHALGELAHALHPFYFEHTEAFQEEGRSASEARLTRVLQAFESLEALEAARRDFTDAPLPGPFLARLYSSALKARLPSPNARCQALLHGVLESYGGPEAEPEALWRLYEERRERLERPQGARVRQYFHHHALNHWMMGQFLSAPSVLVDVFHLVLSGGVLRWALLGHPEVVRLCEAAPPPPEDVARQALEAAAVETFQVLTRHVLRAPDFMAYAVAFAGQGEEQSRELLRALLLGYRDDALQAA